jgi:hypothetical protein
MIQGIIYEYLFNLNIKSNIIFHYLFINKKSYNLINHSKILG